MRASTIIATAIVLVMVGASLGVAIGNVGAAQGTRDAYGYKYTDSKAPGPSVAFNWIDISTTGTDSFLYGDDNWDGPYPIGFNFTFYGNRYTAFNMTTNGFINFGTGSSDRGNDAIPYSYTPDNFIAVYWDDLEADMGEIVYQTFGAAPDRYTVIEFMNVTYWTGSGGAMTFEIVLYESGDILLQYLTMNGMTGAGATEGIENSDGTIGVQYGYNSAVLTDNLAVLFSVGPIIIGPPQTLTGRPGDIVSYTVSVLNRQAFSDSFAITYTSVQGWSVAFYDALLNPLGDTDFDGIPDTGALAYLESATIYVRVTIPASPGVVSEFTTLNASSYLDPLVFDNCLLTTSVLAAWLDPPHSDYGWDRDSDGLYNYLVVSASVYAYSAGWYYIYAELHTSSEWYITYDYNTTYLTVGSHDMDMLFYGWIIRNSGVDGPYHVHLYLYDNWGELMDQGVHTTAAYQDTDFMQPPGELDPPFSDCGVDTEGDGLFDWLQVNVTIDVNYDGDFRVVGYLYDSSWSWITTQTVNTNLDAGSRTVELLYDAWTLSRNGVSGAFNMYIYLYGWVDGIMQNLGYVVYGTSSYDLADFESPPAMFAPPHSDYGRDTDGDFLYDFLVVEVNVNVVVEGDYTIRGDLYDWWGNLVDTVSNTTHLAAGVATVELAFPGWPIRYNDDSDDYDIELFLLNDTMQVDTAWYETNFYWWDDFETAPGWFELPYSATGLDINSDSLYDYLVIQVNVNVTLDGFYRVHADLRDWTWTYFVDGSNTTYLTAGNHTVEILLTGWLIRSNGEDGPFTVLIYLYDEEDREMDTDQFSTPAFLYTDFQTIPATLGWPHTYFADDNDGDTIYERFVVNVSVIVSTPGTFYIAGTMYDGSWWWTAYAGVWATLASGTHEVELVFSAYMMHGHGYDGNYWIYIYLYDENMNYLDSDSLSTTAFNSDDFDPTVPRINSPFADTAPTIDGSFGASEWADAVVVDLTTAFPPNEVPARYLVMNDQNTLFICVDAYGDTTMDNWDQSSFAFDTGNDEIATDGAEDEFWMSGSSSRHYVYDSMSSGWIIDCQPFDDTLTDHAGLEGAVGFGSSTGHSQNHRIYEYAIPLDLLGANDGDLIGFVGRSQNQQGVYDSFTGDASDWPEMFGDSPVLAQYGEIQLSALVVIPPPTTTATVTGTVGSNGWHVSAVSVTLSATGGMGGVDYTEYRLNGGSWQTYSTSIPITGQGTHTLEFRSVDNGAQVEVTKSVLIKIDSVAPVTTPGVSGVHLWLNSSDGTSGAGSTMYRIDNGSWLTYNGVLEITGEGTHSIDYYSVDAAGNTGATGEVTIVVDPTDDGTAGPASDSLLWIALVVAAVVAALVLVMFLMKRKKKQEPTDVYVPTQMPPPVEPPMPPS